MANNRADENALSTGRTTSTPGGNTNFEGFPNDSEGISTFMGNLPDDCRSESEHTMSDMSYDTQDTENAHETQVRKEMSVRRKERNTRSRGSQTSLANISRESVDKDLSWEEYSDRYYTEIETDVSLQWEKMWRDFKSLNRWAKERIQGMLKEFEEYSTDCTDPDEFISKKLKCEYDELRDEAYK